MEQNETTTNDSALVRFDAALHKIEEFANKLEGIARFFPGAGAVVTAVENGAQFAESVVERLDGDVSEVDGASMAAKAISVSTGNPALDSRLQTIEAFIEEFEPLLPLLKLAVKQLGLV